MALECDLRGGNATDIVSRVLHERPPSLAESRSVALEDIQMRNSITGCIRDLNKEAEENGERPIGCAVVSALIHLAEFGAASAYQIGARLPPPGVFARADGSGVLVFHNTRSQCRVSIEVPPNVSFYKVILVDAEKASRPLSGPADPRALWRIFQWVAVPPFP